MNILVVPLIAAPLVIGMMALVAATVDRARQRAEQQPERLRAKTHSPKTPLSTTSQLI